MEDLILGPLMQMVMDKLATPLLQLFQDRYNLKDNITKLQQSVPMIQALLEDAQRQQQTRQAVKQWLMKLEDAAFGSEVLLDELAAEMKACELRKGKAVAGPMFFTGNPSKLFELASVLKKKLQELDQIVEEAFSFNLQEKAAEKMNESSGRSSRETMSALEENIYGREEDKQKILSSLLHDNEEEKIKECPSVISIVGIGGIGKTALAQLVYKEVMVNRHFEMKLWIHVSEDFDLGKLMRSVIVSLAVKAVAKLLKSKKEDYWMSVQDSELWQFKAYQNDVMPALKLSYQFLPTHLKRCLAFCSLFPKDHEIPREKMIYTWMAHGLISPDGGAMQLEVIGGEYFDDLLSLSFFQQVQKHDGGCTTVYKMHDLIHDLVTTVGGHGFSVVSHGLASSQLERSHHLSMVCNFDPSSLPEGLFGAKHLRTLLLLSPGGSSDELNPFWPVNFIYLKVLDLSGYGLKKVDEKVGELICLRYLDLSSNPIQTLPRTICDLYFLQTLNLIDCQNLVELPFEIAKVTSLRHLNVKGCEALIHMPPMVGKLVQLQTLPIYFVGRRPGDSIAQLEFLDLKNELKSLKLQWESSIGSKDFRPATGTSSSNSSLSTQPGEEGDNVESIMKQLEPHSHLKNLHVKGYPGSYFPAWNLPNLTMVELINCRRCQNLPKLGHLRFLEKLHLEEWFSISRGVPLPRLEELVLDKCPMLTTAPAFPSIRHLELHHCDAKIMESMETATSLSSLVINELPKLKSLSGTFLKNNHSLKSLEIRSCQNLLVLPSEIENLTSLKLLAISCCEKLKDLPHGMRKLKSLELLEINGCHSLKMLPYEEIEGLRSLKTLCIENCSNLISFSGGFHHLTALEQLSIMNCPKLTSFPDGFHNLSSLRSLNIEYCPRLAYLPVSLQHATALQSLVIHWCPDLTALPEWFSKFSSLRSLTVWECEKLMSLPEGLQCLTKLQLLSIQDCPILEDLCKRKGVHWRRIEHIPHKYIGSMKL